MASAPIRDPIKDHLVDAEKLCLSHHRLSTRTSELNCLMDRQLLINNIVEVSKADVVYGLPIVRATVNVSKGLNKLPMPPHSQISQELKNAVNHVPFSFTGVVRTYAKSQKSYDFTRSRRAGVLEPALSILYLLFGLRKCSIRLSG